MRLGMYTAELERPTVEALFDAVRAYGFSEVQFSFTSVLGEELPAEIAPELARRIGGAARERGVAVSAVNGTFNMIHPDRGVREQGIRRFRQVAAACGALGCPLLTLCTGSRDPADMWRKHAASLQPDAWADLLETASALVSIAEEFGLLLGVEPEASNTVNTPERARRFLDEMRSDRLKIILDPANLFQEGDARPRRVRPILENAFALLGGDIAAAHGKDIQPGEGIAFTSAGRGIVDFTLLGQLLRDCGYAGGIILHGMKSEEEFAPSVAHVRAALG